MQKALAKRQAFFRRPSDGVVLGLTELRGRELCTSEGWRRATLEDVVTHFAEREWRSVEPAEFTPSHHVPSRPDHSGETAFVIGSGPSLSEVDLGRLEGRLTVGINRALRTGFVPTYMAIIDERVVEMESERLRPYVEAGGRLILMGQWSSPFVDSLSREAQRERVWRLECGHASVGWSLDPSQEIFGNYSTVFMALQVMQWAGVVTSNLVGVDLQHAPDGRTHFFGTVPRNVAVDPWALLAMRACFQLTAPVALAHGMEIVNTSPVSEIEGLRRWSLDRALETAT